MQYQLFLILDYPNYASISLDQAILTQKTQVPLTIDAWKMTAEVGGGICWRRRGKMADEYLKAR